MPGVRGRGHERGQLVQPNAAADVFELASLLELVDQRDCIDRFALRVERKRRAIDLRVALAVEVRRVQRFADRPDRARGEQHCPEDRLFGLEVLGRRDRGGFSELGDRCHSRGVNHWRAGVSTSGRVGFRHGKRGDLQG